MRIFSTVFPGVDVKLTVRTFLDLLADSSYIFFLSDFNRLCCYLEVIKTVLAMASTSSLNMNECSKKDPPLSKAEQWWQHCCDSPVVHGEDHGKAGCPPTAHADPWWSRAPSAALGEPHTRVGACPMEAVVLWEAWLE